MRDLLDQILPDLLRRSWDIHPHWMPSYRVSHYHVSDRVPTISSIQIRLSKSRQLIQWMEDNLLRDFGRQANHIRLECRISEHGFAVQLFLNRDAWIDGKNLVGKVLKSPNAEEYREFLAQRFADMLPESRLQVYRPYRDTDHWWRSQAVVSESVESLAESGEIEWYLGKYRPARHHLSIGVLYKTEDRRISKPIIVQEVMSRLEELYPVYELIAWTRENDYRRFAD